MKYTKCYYCKKKALIYLKAKNNINSNKKINFSSTEFIKDSNEFKPNLFYCKECKIIFSEFCDINFQNNYKDINDILYINQIEFKKIYFKNLINKIAHHIRPSDSVLEIGSYYGAFGSQITKIVNKYQGIELSSYASEYAKKKFNLKIYNGSIKNFFKLNKEKFDIIFMFDVIEHLDDPNLILNSCSKKLNKNGRLIISTMNMDSFFAKITGRYYPWIISMHKFYFSDISMKKFLKKNNLNLIEIINDVRIISLKYLFVKLIQKFSYLKFLNKIFKFLNFFQNIKIKFSFFDINIYCAYINTKS